MMRLVEGIALFIMAAIMYIVVNKFVAPNIVTGTDTGSMIVKSVLPLAVAGMVVCIPLVVLLLMWKDGQGHK
jgi:hypothetical protein